MEEIEINVQGRVQGVGFRWIVKRLAENKKITGFILNEEDKSVSIIAQGEKENLKEFLEKINLNPGFSKIKKMNYKWRKPIKKFDSFFILRKNGLLKDKTKSLWNLYKTLRTPEKVPIHIAIIPDGNRRWAKEKNLEESFGHYKSVNYSTLEGLFNEARESGVKYLSFWGFSTENWKRDSKEVKAIFELVQKLAEKFRKNAKEYRIRFRHIGRKDRLPKKLLQTLKKLEEETKNYPDFNIQLCLDYGGRDEIIRAVNNIIKEKKTSITEEDFKKFLDTKEIPDPDLIIRTSGEKRISGMFPFQGTYAELYFTPLLYPDFNARELRKAIREFSRRNRRFGGNK